MLGRTIRGEGPLPPVRRIRFLTAATTAALSLTLSGCGTPERAQEPAAAESSTATTTAPSPAEPAAPTVFRFEEDQWSPFGHFLIAKVFAQNDDDHRGHGGPVTLFHPEHGEFELDAEELLPGQEVTAQRFASSGTVEHPYVAGIFQVRVPAHDLEPEATVVYLAQIDPATRTIRKKAEVARYGDGQQVPPIDALVGTPGDVVAWNSDSTVSGYDFAADTTAWTRPGYLANATFDSGGGLLRLAAAGKVSGLGCPHEAIVDLATGEDIFDANTLDMKTEENYCGTLRHIVWPSTGTIALLFNPVNKGGAMFYRPAAAYDFVHRQPLVIGPGTSIDDPRSTLIGVDPVEGDNGYEIRDAVTGDLVYAVPRKRADALNLEVVALLDKKLYVKTTDEKLLLDATNGETISRGWQSYPVAVSDSWGLYSDGRFVKE